ncbi:MAG: DNA-directed RNA polymerase subunit beta' [Anaerolineae bacterium]|nr:DNA-directed RNA polymerase subunit beta' [Anaerolineae bacterium]
MNNRNDNLLEAQDFRSLRIKLASPEEIHSWSYGEVTKPETINYRRLRPEKDGLFCEAIFGPTKDYQCYCGKYKNIRYKGIVCDKCGVEVTRSSVRRERMGHIDLAAPAAHSWYTRRVPNHLSKLIGIRKRDMDRVLYFAKYIIITVNEDARQKALQRLEEAFEEKKELREAAAQENIDALNKRLEEEETSIEEQIEEIRSAIDDRLAEATDEVVQEAQSLQKKLENRQGETLQAPMVFKPTGEIVAEQGEVVGREHLTELNTTVQEHLSEIEDKLEAQREEETAPLLEDLEHWREASQDEIAQINNRAAVEVAEWRAQLDTEREELLGLAKYQCVGEPRLRELRSKWGQVFKAGMGAEAFHEILSNLDLDQLAEELWHQVRHDTSKTRRKRARRRLRIVESLRRSGNKPEWIILTVLPVIPPDLRPMVQLDGGRFATSDLNDLYRRVINRNNRLKRLLELGAPDVIVRNEKRMLQEAVDCLIDNSRGKARSRHGRRELKSLSDMLKGKKGRFRRNLLGKRVDYSGRSVIIVGPKLKMHQCGLPKSMALELYRPFVISKLVEYNYATNVKAAKRLIERERPEVWEVLEEVIHDRPVLLNRAPTLHRLGIQAFEPVMIEGKAIQLHPLVCPAFNADFDGDQMAVHVPLSEKAVEEARTLMLSTQNLLKPANGQPLVGPTKDMCLGIYYLTMDDPDYADEEPKLFVDLEELQLAYDLGHVDLHTPVLVGQVYDDQPAPEEPVETTVGRCIFNTILPDEIRFVNEPLEKGGLQDLIGLCYRRLGRERTTELADNLKDLGFKYATRSGITIAISDLIIPLEKDNILEKTEDTVTEVDRQYRRGLLTEEEQYTRTVELWSRAREKVADVVARAQPENSTVSVMARSGASKGGYGPISQLAGMRGLMADPSGRIIPLPIRSSLREGLSALEYFISTHGSRKGLADTALRTADAGYLTRRLVDVAQDVIINAHDCGTKAGIWIHADEDVGGQSMGERLIGRVAASPIAHPETGELIVDRNGLIDEEAIEIIERSEIEEVMVRSPSTCQLRHGICALCYGRDMGRGHVVGVGTAVGIIAAQSIGEPGTQLTLRTFHSGGVAAGRDITVGLPRAEELFEARKTPKGEAPISEVGGIAHINKTDGQRYVIVVDTRTKRFEYDIEEGWTILVEDGDDVQAGDALASLDDEDTGSQQIEAEKDGRLVIDDRHITLIHEERREVRHKLPQTGRILVEEGQKIAPGTQLVEGVKNPRHILQVLGRKATEMYLLTEVQQVYRSQGVNINDKHFEIIFRKMLSKVRVTKSGDTDLLPGRLIRHLDLEDINREVVEEGGEPAKAAPVLLGITKAALNTESFLSAASFQHTIRVLTEAAAEGREDPLLGLKENVIIGKLIPAGTGYRGNNPSSDGPIESYEGVLLQVAPEEEAPPEEEEEEKLVAEPEAAEEAAEGEETEEEPTVKKSEILGIATPG